MLKVVFTYLLIINLLGFLIMFIDKQRAIHKEWRIPEKHSLVSLFWEDLLECLLECLVLGIKQSIRSLQLEFHSYFLCKFS